MLTPQAIEDRKDDGTFHTHKCVCVYKHRETALYHLSNT